MSYLNEKSISAETPSKKKYKRWSKEVRSDDVTKMIEVEEVTNGYIITVSKYGTGEDGKYMNECTKKISSTNPFEKEEEKKEDDIDLMGSASNSIDNYL